MTAFQEIQAIVNRHFGNEVDKINAWWKTPNPLLGELSPAEMVHAGRAEKLLKVIREWVEGNRP